jgi:hypothetical protein
MSYKLKKIPYSKSIRSHNTHTTLKAVSVVIAHKAVLKMTKRKSGLPDDDSSITGLTSLCNHDSGEQSRAAALLIEQDNIRTQRYTTVTLTDLSSWPAVVEYKALTKRLQEQVLEYYTWVELRKTGMCYDTMQAIIAQQFSELLDCQRDELAQELCNIHTIIEYTLHTQVLPEYVMHHTVGGEQTVHWASLVPGSATQHQRQHTLERDAADAGE